MRGSTARGSPSAPSASAGTSGRQGTRRRAPREGGRAPPVRWRPAPPRLPSGPRGSERRAALRGRIAGAPMAPSAPAVLTWSTHGPSSSARINGATARRSPMAPRASAASARRGPRASAFSKAGRARASRSSPSASTVRRTRSCARGRESSSAVWSVAISAGTGWPRRLSGVVRADGQDSGLSRQRGQCSGGSSGRCLATSRRRRVTLMPV